ncbi:MAG: hypothetical protein HQM01_06100, partial [Magnetococcales bacterium]|nr:hypothetical protein [Magnetococcales bacterium]
DGASFSRSRESWGEMGAYVQELRIADVPFCEILQGRMERIAENSYQTELSEYYKNFLSHYIYSVVYNEPIEFSEAVYEQRNAKGFELLRLLFRNNRRKFVNFMPELIEEHFCYLRRNITDVDFLEKWSNKDARENAEKYFKDLPAYIFWNVLLYRKSDRYTAPDYNLERTSDELLRRCVLERQAMGDDYPYITLPNLFSWLDFIGANRRCRNNVLMRHFILYFLRNTVCSINTLIDLLKQYGFSLNKNTLLFEIDELFVNGLIETTQYRSKQTIGSSPSLKTTEFFDLIDRLTSSHYVFDALSPVIKYNYRVDMEFNGYFPFIMRRRSTEVWYRDTIQAFVSQLVIAGIMISYLRSVDKSEEEHYNNIKSKLSKIHNKFEMLEWDTFSIRAKLNKLEKTYSYIIKDIYIQPVTPYNNARHRYESVLMSINKFLQNSKLHV